MVARRPGLWRHPAGLAACFILSLLAVMAALAPWIAPQDPLVQVRADRFLSPSLAHPFGTDEFGRDILSRVIHGARISLFTGAVAVLMGAAVGVPLGLLGGFVGGPTDAGIMRVLDFLLAVPAILLAMVIIAILGPGSFNAMLAVGIVSIPSFARLTRASTLTLKEREFVMATRALGVGPGYLMFRTILLIRDDAHRRPGRGHRGRGDAPRGGPLLPRARHSAAHAGLGPGLQCPRHGGPDVLARHPPGALLRPVAPLVPALWVRAGLPTGRACSGWPSTSTASRTPSTTWPCSRT